MHTSRSRTVALLPVLFAGALLMGAPGAPAYAQQRVATTFQYSAKALCTFRGDAGFGDAFAPGRYRTVINIHNPTDRRIEITRKFALSLQPGEAAGSFSITPYKSLSLEPDQAVAYSCGDIVGFFCPIDGVCVDFIAVDGFLVVNSPVELDVVAVYTANPRDAQISTMDTETIAGRRLPKTIVVRADQPPPAQPRRIEIEPFKAVKP